MLNKTTLFIRWIFEMHSVSLYIQLGIDHIADLADHILFLIAPVYINLSNGILILQQRLPPVIASRRTV